MRAGHWPGGKIPHMPKTVLIVDDHAGFRGFARRLVESAGYAVVGEAADGRSALESAQKLDPDVVLLDVVLPDMSGFEVAELLAHTGERPAVILTSSRSASDLGPRLQENARPFVSKLELSGGLLQELIG